MSATDKAKNKAEEVKGKAKEKLGHLTGDADQEQRGRTDQTKSDVKDAGEKVKDAFKH
ncbi:CsbD family protein [Nocardia yamanashiensis]|uniref:CsbD family protein n=1 Tax=Nocardia yamanashiensis TaxID=209247 RepID=UPI001E61308B|nr:CsbD family protein [Nocardia yamanashiensis]UGT44793.1 CsbD family protein [Nocardia yamanashiensis]